MRAVYEVRSAKDGEIRIAGLYVETPNGLVKYVKRDGEIEQIDPAWEGYEGIEDVGASLDRLQTGAIPVEIEHDGKVKEAASLIGQSPEVAALRQVDPFWPDPDPEDD